MLGSVGFDGYSRTAPGRTCSRGRGAVHPEPTRDRRAARHRRRTSLGLLAASRSSWLAFLAACARRPRDASSAPRSLAPEFVLSLVPIAFVYLVAHYFSLFVVQGQFVVPLLSDPFGKGWDLFGTAG